MAYPVSSACNSPLPKIQHPKGPFLPNRQKKDSYCLGLQKIWAEPRGQGIDVNHQKPYRLYCSINLQKPPVVPGKKHYLHDRITPGRTIKIFSSEGTMVLSSEPGSFRG